MTNVLRVNSTLTVSLLALLWAAAPPDSPVADAAMLGQVEAVRALLDQGADVNAAQGDGMTALHWAAEGRSAEMADLLIAAGANLAAVTRLGDYTSLHLAAKAGSASVVRALLEAGAEAGVVTSTGGATPLHFAATSGSGEAVTALLDNGADHDVREAAWGQTPLMFAAATGRVDAIRALLDGGADPGDHRDCA